MIDLKTNLLCLIGMILFCYLCAKCETVMYVIGAIFIGSLVLLLLVGESDRWFMNEVEKMYSLAGVERKEYGYCSWDCDCKIINLQRVLILKNLNY